jgi:hypothetical protein
MLVATGLLNRLRSKRFQDGGSVVGRYVPKTVDELLHTLIHGQVLEVHTLGASVSLTRASVG